MKTTIKHRWSCPMPDPNRPAGGDDSGLALTAHRWVTVGSRLYAVVGCHANVGFENPERTERTDVRDAEHPFRARRMHDRYCREVSTDSGSSAMALPTFAFPAFEDAAEGSSTRRRWCTEIGFRCSTRSARRTSRSRTSRSTRSASPPTSEPHCGEKRVWSMRPPSTGSNGRRAQGRRLRLRLLSAPDGANE